MTTFLRRRGRVFLLQPVGTLEILCFTVAVLLVFKLFAVFVPELHNSRVGIPLAWLLDQIFSLRFALIGAFIVHIWTRPSRLQFFSVIVVACILDLVASVGGSPPPKSVAAAFLGVGSLAVLSLGVCASRGAKRMGYLADLAAAAVIPVFSFPLGAGLRLTYLIEAHARDALLYRFEQTLGFQPSIVMGRWLESWPLLLHISSTVYNVLPTVVCLFYALQRRRKDAFRVNILAEMGIAAVVGYTLYFLYPAAGPRYLLGAQFPWHPPAAFGLGSRGLAIQPSPLNAMPSLHMGWVLLLWWNSAGSQLWLRVVTAFVLVFTVCATLGFGEHYLIDLVVAFPFALAIHGWCLNGVPNRIRYFALAMGGMLVGASLSLLSFCVPVFESHPSLSWVFVLMNVLPASFLANRLLKASSKRMVHETDDAPQVTDTV